MNPSITDTAEAISRHEFEKAYPFILDDAEWTVIGGGTIVGKDDIVRALEGTAAELANTQTTFDRFKVIVADGYVVTDSQARYVDEDGEASEVASCDIYEFKGEMLSAITSYTLEIEQFAAG